MRMCMRIHLCMCMCMCMRMRMCMCMGYLRVDVLALHGGELGQPRLERPAPRRRELAVARAQVERPVLEARAEGIWRREIVEQAPAEQREQREVRAALAVLALPP